ncbi:2-C-methyl-D-erythritol 2,4-cyclodiphosphate synthase [Bifidobacterium sp. LC6]|uniref:2-C-methyl-D-erythritol 2,4-cyclodiphosphate synthase n=1 Tax=Bifidobacterium colobi TaxID=2809026 RepID=A0ABS5UUY6_9BIFI|nr:2-C-methyl-D-erythritol 2,4-cyclodiphosphate synthase [Bifidobacterium colobi]MBT1174839.1 2-C-methyl-D-erythritol 2,4-cyclodiphosphate synthase [Bifidobacterium colobi]
MATTQSGLLIGQGFDAHRFAVAGTGRPLWVAGLHWPVPEGADAAAAARYEGIEGDSDGDVAAHALIDALLSAAGLGDIGSLFGVGATAHGAGMHGGDMLRETVAVLREHGYEPSSASVVIIGNRPKIGTRRAEAEQALSEAVGCRVSVTATTTDHMGFTGRGEGIAAIANALVAVR